MIANAKGVVFEDLPWDGERCRDLRTVLVTIAVAELLSRAMQRLERWEPRRKNQARVGED